MEMLWDVVYVEDQYRAIEAERQRQYGTKTLDSRSVGRLVMLDAVWSPSLAEKELVVMDTLLQDLIAQTEHALDTATAPEVVKPTTETVEKTALPPDVPMSSQLGLGMFFRVCASLRSTTNGAIRRKLLSTIASKIPSMLARLPPMPLASGVASTMLPVSTADANVSQSVSVFEELLSIFGALLEPKPRAGGHTEPDEALSDVDRANVLMAFVAVSLKWGRLRDLVHVLYLLITHPNELSAFHIQQLSPLLSELVNSDAVVPTRQLLPEESIATGYLVSFGKGDHGKLGHGQCTHASCTEGNCTENKNVPTVIASTRDIKFVKIDSLSTHSIAITTKGEVMAWGNGDKYRLGHGTTTKEYAPRIIDALSLKGKVTDVACGLGHTLALMLNGDIYAWGNGSNGRLGLGDTNDRSHPTKLTITIEGSSRTTAISPAQTSSSSSNGSFRNVVCGASHSLAVTADGRVFAWGKNNQGQCGHGHTNDQLTAIEIRHFRDELNERIVCAAGGWEHTLFCSTSGRVYSSGCGYKDSRRAGIPPVLGHGDCEKRLKPTVIQTFVDANEEMVRVSCGWDHSLAVSAQGALYTWGSGTNGKLGHGDEENCETPTLVRSLVGKFVKDAKAGCEHTVALTDTRELWTFGQGDSGRLGLGDTATRKVPTMVDFFTHSGLQPVAIAVGDKYNLVLADNCGSVRKSPRKHAPPSPLRFDCSSTGRSRRATISQAKLSQVVPLRDVGQLIASHEDMNLKIDGHNNSCKLLPHDQDQLLKLLAISLARLATRYTSSLWVSGDTSVNMLPYGIDTAPITFERVLTVIRACQDRLTQSPRSDLLLESIIVCLRLLTVNVSQWVLQSGGSETVVSSLAPQIRKSLDELTCMEMIQPEQGCKADRTAMLRQFIREETAQVLRVGFTIFFPTTSDRVHLVSELGSRAHPASSNQLSPHVESLMIKLCEASVSHDLLLKSFLRSGTHKCAACQSRDDAKVTDSLPHNVTSFHQAMTTLLSECTEDTIRLLERNTNEKNSTLDVRVRVLNALQHHWFGIVACSLTVGQVNRGMDGCIEQASATTTICDCCIIGLSDYLCMLVDDGTKLLKSVCQVQCESLESASGGLRFLNCLVLPAIQASCSFIASLHSKTTWKQSTRASQVDFNVRQTLLRSVRSMLEVVDETLLKLSSVSTIKNSDAVGTDPSCVEKLGIACAVLCSEVASSYFSSVDPGDIQSASLSNQVEAESSVSQVYSSSPHLGDGLRLFVELLQVRSPSLMSAILNKILQVLELQVNKRDRLQATFAEDPKLLEPLPELCTQLTDAVGNENLPTRARTIALSIWLWVLHHCRVESAWFSQLVVENGIAVLAGEILLDGKCIGDELQHQKGHHPTASQRIQQATRFRPVEDMISSLRPSQAFYTIAYEVFAAATTLLFTTFVPPQDFCHPLLGPFEKGFARVCSTRSSSLPATRLTTTQTVKALFDLITHLLCGFLESRKAQSEVLSPFTHLSVQKGTAQGSPTVSFLLASPLSISGSRSHIVKPLRLPRATLPVGQANTASIKAISLWFFVDTLTSVKDSSSATQNRAVLVLAALGEATDRLQENAVSAGSSTAVELSTSDGVQGIVFIISDNGLLRLGWTVARDPNEVLAAPTSVLRTQPTWDTWIADEMVASCQWLHVAISFTRTDIGPETYINGKRASWKSVQNSSSCTRSANGGFGVLTPRVQLVVGGTLDQNLMEATGITSIIQAATSLLPLSSSQSSVGPTIDLLVDDVWVFADAICETTAQQLFLQGQTLFQIKRVHDDDGKILDSLCLLKKLLELQPLKQTSEMTIAGKSQADSAGTLVQNALFQIQGTCRSESSFKIALRAVEIAKLIVPVASVPSHEVLESLLECIRHTDGSVYDVRDEVTKLLAFSARPGVQSAAVSASQVMLAGLLQQTEMVKAPSTNGHDIVALQNLLTDSVIDLVQKLSSLTAWRPLCIELLDKAAARLTKMVQSDTTAESNFAETVAVIAMVAGYSEGFKNVQLMSVEGSATADQLALPWASTQNSTFLFASDSYREVLWRFGCNFDDTKFNLTSDQVVRDSNKRLQAHDRAVLMRVYLQTLILRSLVGQLIPSSQPSASQNLHHRILSDPDAVSCLLRAAMGRTVDVVKTRLGPDRKIASKLVSMQLLQTMLFRSKSRFSAIPRLLIEEDLEVLCAGLYLKLQSQQSLHSRDLSSIQSQHYWREPRTLGTSLECLSGDVEIRGLQIRSIQHFPTIRLGRVTITANSGLWYFEVKLLTDGLMQIGYVDSEFVPDAVQGQGVGDHTNSWAFDGYRRKKWNMNSSEYGEIWKTDDVVGVLLDSDRLELSYFLNGKFLGVAFSNLQISPTSLLFPAISLNADQHVRFDFGNHTNADRITQRRDSSMSNLCMPVLNSPLDVQRLQPVVVAMEENGATNDECDEGYNTESDSDKDDEEMEGTGGEDAYTPTTPVSATSYKIYHPSTSNDEPLFHSQHLPGSLHDEESDLSLASLALVSSIQPSIGAQTSELNRDGSDDGDQDEPNAKAEDTRKADLVHGLVNLGFPLSWATRCAEETTFTLSDTGAISWILEQMEGEAASSMTNMLTPRGAVQDGTAEDIHRDALSSTSLPRRAHDDLSLNMNRSSAPMGPHGRRNWQLTLSPTRDGRPHSEQFLRTHASLTSPQKQKEPPMDAHAAGDTVNVNLFLTVVSEDDEDDGEVLEHDARSWNASASHEFYRRQPTDSLRQRCTRLDLSINAEVTKSKDDTPRQQPPLSDRHEEDLLPAAIVAHSVLSLAYVRVAVETLLFGNQSDVSEVYPVVAQWAGTGLLEFLRMQLQLSPYEIPVSCARSTLSSDIERVQMGWIRMLQYEVDNTPPLLTPLLQAVVTEILARMADGLRDLKQAETAFKASHKMLVRATNARWVLWLISTLEAALSRGNKGHDSISIAIQPLLEPACIRDVTKLAAAGTSVNTMVWRNAAFAIIRHQLSMDAFFRSSQTPRASITTLLPVQFFVEVLAKMMRKDQSRRIAYGDPIPTLWEIVIDNIPLTKPLLPGNISVKNEIILRVEHVASTCVTISWECKEPIISADEALSSADSVLSLSVNPRSHCSSGVPSSVVSTGWMAGGVPHYLPSKGSMVLRQLAPDTQYTIRVTKSTTLVATNEAAVQDESRPVSTVIEQIVCVHTPPEPLFELDGEAAGKNLVLLNRNRTVKNLVNKKWHTVRATVGFDEGVHHWHVRIDSCVSKNIFIGICTTDASLDNYVGSDAYGYGFLANKAVWHNKSKLHSYGEIFKQGDLLQVTLDCNIRTLSYTRNGEFLGVAASNLHVANGNGSDTGNVRCKWFPAFSLYNKDDQLTMLVPRESITTNSLSRSSSQYETVYTLVDSARLIHAYAHCMRRLQMQDIEPSTCAVDIYKRAYATWQKWKRGDTCWRELGIGEIVEIDAQPDVVLERFGLTPGESLFTSRGQCVVLGVYNQELWYEIVDALELSSFRKTTPLGSWSLSMCREMVNSPDEYPVHRSHKVTEDRDGEGTSPDDTKHLSETVFQQIHQNLESIRQLDTLLMSLVDALVVHRGLSSPYQLSCADLSSAIVLHDVVDSVSLLMSSGAVLDQNAILMRLGFLYDLNQHVYRIVRLYLSQNAESKWEQSLCALKDLHTGSDVDPEKERQDWRIAAARLAVNVGFPTQSLSVSVAGDPNAITMERQELLEFLKSHLFETQRERLITEALRRTATPTLVGVGSDSKTSDLGGTDDSLVGEPKEMLRLSVHLPTGSLPKPFFEQDEGCANQSELSWMVPRKELRSCTLFAQVSTQLRSIDPVECCRQFSTPSDSLAMYRTFHLTFLDPPGLNASGETSSEALVFTDTTSQYLKFWDELIIEIQSPRFPLLIPTTSTGELHVNAHLLLPEYAVRCDVCNDEPVEWFFQLGQILGMIWRAKTIVPLQFVSLAFWKELLQDGRYTETSRLHQARAFAVRTIRDGLCSIVPYECLQLSSPQSIRSRLSDSDLFQIERLQREAVYDHEASHHQAFWTTIRTFTSLERHALMRFLSGKATSRWSLHTVSDDPIEQWKRLVTNSTSTASASVMLSSFRLELVDALADAHDHPDACFPVVRIVDAHCSCLHLPVYSSASVLRQKLILAMSTIPSLR